MPPQINVEAQSTCQGPEIEEVPVDTQAAMPRADILRVAD
jgi:hypothetical protein